MYKKEQTLNPKPSHVGEQSDGSWLYVSNSLIGVFSVLGNPVTADWEPTLEYSMSVRFNLTQNGT